MSHKSGHVIIARLGAPLFYDDVSPADGIGKYVAKLRVWHLLPLAFLLGLPF